MRVLHVITGLDAGGAEQQLRLLLQHLSVRCEVATLTRPGAIAATVRDSGIPVFDVEMAHNRDLSVLSRLEGLMSRGRYDLVHTHLYRACVYGRMAARLAGVPHIVATEHSIGDRLIEGRPISAGVRRLYLSTERYTDATIAVSDTVARRLVGWGVPAERLVVIPNGIDAAEFRYDPALRAFTRARLCLGPRDYLVGAVGRLEPTKQFDLLVRALRGLDDATLLLVGEGSQRAVLEELARAEGVSGRVRFTGETPNVRAQLCAMDVLAAPSDEETFGLAVLEALACGLPVVYVACPALDELPPNAAPGARRTPLDIGWFRTELAAVRQSAPNRLPPPPAVTRYDIAPLAAQVELLYEQVRAGRPPTSPSRPLTRPPTSPSRPLARPAGAVGPASPAGAVGSARPAGAVGPASSASPSSSASPASSARPVPLSAVSGEESTMASPAHVLCRCSLRAPCWSSWSCWAPAPVSCSARASRRPTTRRRTSSSRRWPSPATRPR